MSRLNNTPQHASHRLRWVGHLVTFLPALITVLQAYGILTGEQVNAWVALAILCCGYGYNNVPRKNPVRVTAPLVPNSEGKGDFPCARTQPGLPPTPRSI